MPSRQGFAPLAVLAASQQPRSVHSAGPERAAVMSMSSVYPYANAAIDVGLLGEGLPFMLHRINDQTRLAAARRGRKRIPAQYSTENLVVTCSGNFSALVFLCTVMALGVDNVLFSVDWPYESNVAAVDFLKRQPLGPHEMEKVAHLNAERVLRLWQSAGLRATRGTVRRSDYTNGQYSIHR
jgi:hypothetical protein